MQGPPNERKSIAMFPNTAKQNITIVTRTKNTMAFSHLWLSSRLENIIKNPKFTQKTPWNNLIGVLQVSSYAYKMN